jgi:hypothetical protein
MGNTMNETKFIPSIPKLQSDVLPQIKQAFGPLFFATAIEKGQGNVIDNGSFAFVSTKTKLLLVTCYHVWNGFLAAREKNPELKFYACFDDKHSVCICTTIDGTQTKPIDQNEKLDITVFDMEPFQEFLGEQGKNFFYPLTIPVSQLTTNDLVGVIGSPGKQRFETEKGTGFGRQPYFAYVLATSGFTIRVDFTRVMSLDRELTYKQGDKKPATAGVSGGPCFLINTDYKSYLIGIVTDHVCYEGRQDNYLTVTTANCINEDGTLKTPDSFYNT